MSLHRSLQARRAVLAVAVSLAFVDIAGAQVSPGPEPFPAFRDGHLVPSPDGDIHRPTAALAGDAAQAAQDWCGDQTIYPGCKLIGHVEREISGADGKQSAYSKLDITLELIDRQGQASQRVIDGGIALVRSCPSDAMLVNDYGGYLDNRARSSGVSAVACLSPDALPKPDSLGVPEESGANQCPIGNSPLVGNPINPLTGSKIEQVTDYAGPASSGLTFARTYHSGAFPLSGITTTIAARYPAGARIGARWRHSFDRAFVRRPHFDANGNAYTTALYLIREDGRETRFIKQGNTFVPGDGERGSLREHPEGGWVYTWIDLSEERYDEQGRLRSRTDANGNTLSLQYDEIIVGIGLKATVLVRVTDRQGRELRLGYDRLGRVETVDTPDGRINYSYSGDLLEGLDADLVRVRYPDGHHTDYLYDEPAMGGTPNHKLTGIVGGDGQRFATFEYDGQNRARRSSHGGDLTWTEVSQASGRIDVATKDVTYAESWTPIYDQGHVRLGRRAVMLTSGAPAREFEYLGNGLVARQTDYLGVATMYSYDASRRLETERTEAEGTPVARTVRTTWHPVFDKPVRIDNGAQWTIFAYDGKGNLIERREGGLADAGRPDSGPWPEERITGYTYDDAGRLLAVDGALAGSADTTRIAYRSADDTGCTTGGVCAWRRGDLHTVTNALGHVSTVLSHDAAGRVLASTNANGVRTERRYDTMGRPVEIAVRARIDGAPSDRDNVTRLTYTANGDLEKVTDADGAFVTHSYDAARRLVEQVDANGNRRTLVVDGLDHVTEESFFRTDGSKDAVRRYEYDHRGVLRSMSAPGLGTRNYEFDDNHRLIGVTDEGDIHIGDVRAYERDALGRVQRIERGYPDLGSGSQTHITYDGSDRIKTVVDPKGLSTSYLRNGLGDLLWRTSPDTGDSHIENDSSGQPIHTAPADGRTIDWTYDLLGRPVSATYGDGQTTTYTYDSAPPVCGTEERFAVGRLSSVDDASGRTVFCYDFAGRITRKVQTTRGVSLTIHYEYTRSGRLHALTYPDGHRVRYERDVAGNVTSIEQQAPAVAAHLLLADVRHDATGRVIGWMAGERQVQRRYNLFGDVTRLEDGRADGLTATFTYSGFGMLGTLQTNADTLPRQILTDTASRLTTGTTPYQGTGSTLGQRYAYDSTGNRLRWWSLLPLADQRYAYATNSHHLLTSGTIAREYDAAGNTTRIGEREFLYDATGRMSQAKVNGVVEMNYAYNAFGQQVAKFIAGETTISLHDEAGHWLGDYDSAGRAIRQVVWLDNLPVAVLDGESIRDIQPDHLGAPRVVIDRAANKTIWSWPLNGEAFGSTPPDEDPDGDGNKYVFDMRFPGQRYDAVTGLFQNGWRDYDPQSGRYIQSDPIGLAGGISTYAYVGNNPYMRTDSTGLRADMDLCAGLSAQACMQMGTNFLPDYVVVNATIPSVFSLGYTVTKYGTVFGHGGGTVGNIKGIGSGKNWGLSVAAGRMTSKSCPTSAEVDDFVKGVTSGASFYRGIGGGIATNNTGTAIEIGFGFGGGSFDHTYSGQGPGDLR